MGTGTVSKSPADTPVGDLYSNAYPQNSADSGRPNRATASSP